MNPRHLACSALLAAVLGGTPFTAASAAIPAGVAGMRVPSLAPMIRQVSPAVVTIATRGVMPDSDGDEQRDDPFYNRFFHDLPGQGPNEEPFAAAGSGVIVDAKHGYILTNAHVVDHATSITVTLQDGRNLKAKVVGTDPPSDIAVVKVAARGLAQIRFGDSSRLAVGDFVVAIGNPFGLPHSVTSGIVSGLKRTGFSPDDFENYIQTDASINPGNSGGALVDLRGDLVGINTAILSASGDNIGIGFAIPVNTARRVMRQLIEYGAVDRGQLGLNIYAVTPAVARSLGLHKAAGGLVAQVIPGSPADKAGVRAGDVVTTIAGHRIGSNTDLREAIGLLRVGDPVTIDLLRDGRQQQRRAVLANTLAGAPASSLGKPAPGHRH
ncbi:MAG: trypsin-like peptidase domain-containing protein [Steroidobacteraceae bacterium]